MILSFVHRIKKWGGKGGENSTDTPNATLFDSQSPGNFKAGISYVHIAQPEFHKWVLFLEEKEKLFTASFMLHIFISGSVIQKKKREGKICPGFIAGNKIHTLIIELDFA